MLMIDKLTTTAAMGSANTCQLRSVCAHRLAMRAPSATDNELSIQPIATAASGTPASRSSGVSAQIITWVISRPTP